MSQSQSQSCVKPVVLYHFGTEVIVNLAPNTVVEVKINDAQFVVKGSEILSKRESKVDLTVSILDHSISNVRSFKYLGIYLRISHGLIMLNT